MSLEIASYNHHYKSYFETIYTCNINKTSFLKAKFIHDIIHTHYIKRSIVLVINFG